jgi:hypothetical protein
MCALALKNTHTQQCALLVLSLTIAEDGELMLCVFRGDSELRAGGGEVNRNEWTHKTGWKKSIKTLFFLLHPGEWRGIFSKQKIIEKLPH